MKEVARKPVHIHLLDDIHSHLKVECAKRGLTMQEVVETFVCKFLDGDETALKIVNDLETGKKTKKIRRLSNNEQDALYKIIEELGNAST
jgi:hypothetical protein